MMNFVCWKRYLSVLLSAVLLVVGVFMMPDMSRIEAARVTAGAAPEGNSFDNEERKIFELINKERRKYDLHPLDWSSELADLARSYSKQMARENFFSHYDPRGNSVAERAKAMKIKRWHKIGENLFMCDGYEKFTNLAIKGWMNSPSHRENILEIDYNATGIGVARSSNGAIFVTQVFLQD
jgi:uncharacterized protein YkwD